MPEVPQGTFATEKGTTVTSLQTEQFNSTLDLIEDAAIKDAQQARDATLRLIDTLKNEILTTCDYLGKVDTELMPPQRLHGLQRTPHGHAIKPGERTWRVTGTKFAVNLGYDHGDIGLVVRQTSHWGYLMSVEEIIGEDSRTGYEGYAPLIRGLRQLRLLAIANRRADLR